MKLYYNSPAKKLKPQLPWNELIYTKVWENYALPVGNGSLGLGVMGNPCREQIVVNHKTLWRGGPSPKRPNYIGGNKEKADKAGKTPLNYYNEIKELFLNGEDKKASDLCNKLTGEVDGYGAYICWGRITAEFFSEKTKFESYERALDLDTAVCSVNCKTAGKNVVTDRREAFVSYPDNVAVMRFERKEGNMTAAFSFTSAQGAVSAVSKKGIFQSGKVRDNGLKYSAALLADTDGKVTVRGTKLRVSNASYITLYLAADTDYMDNYPVYRTGESSQQLKAKVLKTAEAAKALGYEAVKNRHLEDYKKLYNRLSLDLGSRELPPTDELLKAYNNGKCSDAEKRGLETLLYQYGRYLTITSSRETDILPSNLQGIWNVSNHPTWSSDFHLNVNLQMNYWPTYSGNLAECAMPLIRYIDKLREPGRLTAKIYTGVKSNENAHNGFLFHTQNTPFGWTCPGWDFGWGWSPAAVPWILHNLFEHYEYTLDKKILGETVYPMLRETADYFEKLLVTAPDGRLVSVPCFSPEHGPRTLGNTYEQSLIWQLYEDAALAARALGVDEFKAEHWDNIKAKLRPIEIGEDGQIKEWYHETKLGKIGQKHHRHMSHLLGLYPGNLINKFENPEEIKAAEVSMNDRGDVSTGWAMAQRINSWARVGDGNHALKLIGDLMKNGINKNLWDSHPPFQIDGNFGYTAAVNEMLMQSHTGYIELLPALPDKWAQGKISGIIARGNFEITMEWENGKLKYADILSRAGATCKLIYVKNKLRLADETVSHSYDENGALCFLTEKGKVYRIVVA